MNDIDAPENELYLMDLDEAGGERFLEALADRIDGALAARAGRPAQAERPSADPLV